MAIELESHDLLVRRAIRQRSVGGIVTLCAIVAIVCGFAASQTADFLAWIIAGVVGLIVGPMIVASAGRDPTSRAHAGGRLLLEPTENVLRILPADRRIAVDDVEGAWIEEDYVCGTLVVESKDGTTIAARFLDDQRERVEALLGGLGVDARLTVMRLAATERSTRGCAGGCLMLATLVGFFPVAAFVIAVARVVFMGTNDQWILTTFALPTLLVGMVTLLAARALSSTTVRIGADGVRIGRRFVPYSELSDVSHAESGVVFETVNDKRTRVRCLGIQAVTVVERVQAALDRFRGTDVEADLSLLDRAEQGVHAWRAKLAQLLERSNYRARALGKDDLLDVVENPSASAERRAGAILALRGHIDDDDRRRVRIAYEGCAEPNTRAALEAALDEEIDQLEIALISAPRSRAL